MFLKKLVDLTMIWNCFRNRKYDEHWYEIYLSLIFLVFKDFMGFLRKLRKYVISPILRILKYLIHETILKFFIKLLAHSLLLIIFKYLRHWR